MISPAGGGRLVGYARVSTGGQDFGLQLDALQKHGVPNQLIFTTVQATGVGPRRRATTNGPYLTDAPLLSNFRASTRFRREMGKTCGKTAISGVSSQDRGGAF